MENNNENINCGCCEDCACETGVDCGCEECNCSAINGKP